MRTALLLLLGLAASVALAGAVQLYGDDEPANTLDSALDAADELAQEGASADATEAARLAAEQSAEYAREVMDHHMVSRTGQVSAEREASNPCSGHGALNERGECDCRDGYTGPTCSLKGLGDHHEYGRFVGDKRCENGVAVGDHCECDAGWEGFHCHRRACLHGSFRCPDGSKFCIKAACVCDEGFQGASCAEVKKACQPYDCKNTGEFDMDACACRCEAPWTGALCDQCLPRQCPNGMVQDPNNCGCVCPASKECSHGGVLDMDTCACNCTSSWAGPTCDQCVKQVCHNGGIFNEDDCMCECMPPYDPTTNCRTCPELECMNGGVFQPGNCSCTCPGLWMSDMCDECPSDEELALQGVDCGARGFNRETCACNVECPPVQCMHGGRQSPDTCACECNLHNNRTADWAARGGDLSKPPANPEANHAEAPGLQEAEPRDDNATRATQASMFNDTLDVLEEVSLLQVMLAGMARAEPQSPTFWAGERCEVCRRPATFSCPGMRQFNTTTCACNAGCPGLACQNGGAPDESACECRCQPPWAGALCDAQADGKSPATAAISCNAILDAFPDAKDGLYWINPKGDAPSRSAFQVMCDMTSDDGGWAQLAKVGERLRDSSLTAANYRDGLGSPLKGAEYVLPCSKFDGLDGLGSAAPLANVVMRVTMGEVHDFFRPTPGASLCDMLTSQNKHEWSSNAGFPFEDEEEEEEEAAPASLLAVSVAPRLRAARRLLQEEEVEGGDEDDGTEWRQPDFISDPRLSMLLGGSAKGYPLDIDGREYVSFWGGDKGGCCHYASELFSDTVDSGSWGREFTIHVREVNQESSEEVEEASPTDASAAEGEAGAEAEAEEEAEAAARQ